jgi:hypothetical protein
MPNNQSGHLAKWPVSDSILQFETFGGDATFDAKFYAGGAISLRYGSINKHGRRNGYRTLENGYLDRLSTHFSGRLIPPTANNKTVESVQGWIEDHGISTWLSSYVCPLLVELGYAERRGEALLFR